MKRKTRRILKAVVLLIVLFFSTAEIKAQEFYVATAAGDIRLIDPFNCTNKVVCSGSWWTDIAMDTLGNLYGVSSFGFYKINLNDCSSELLAYPLLGVNFGYNALVYVDGRLYASTTVGEIVSLDLSTLEAKFIGKTGFQSGGDLMYYKGEFYLVTSSNQIVKVNMDNPSLSYEYDDLGPEDGIRETLYGINTIPHYDSCGEVKIYVSGTSGKIHEYDYDTKRILNTCVVGESIYGAASVWESQVDIEPEISLGPDITICPGELRRLSVGNYGGVYNWNNGESSEKTYLADSGTVTVEVNFPGGCSAYDTINIDREPWVELNLGPDTIVCKGVPYVPIDAGVEACEYSWNDGIVKTREYNAPPGLNTVQISTKHNCIYKDQITITVDETVDVDLGKDTVLCPGESPFTIAPKNDVRNLRRTWSDGSSDVQMQTQSEGLFWIQVEDDKCNWRDSIKVSFHESPDLNLGSDTTVCPQKKVVLASNLKAEEYLWDGNASLIDSFSVLPGIHSLALKDSNGCFVTDTINIIGVDTLFAELGHDTTKCENEDAIELSLQTNASGDAQVIWQDAFQQTNFYAAEGGTYFVKVEEEGCAAVDTIVVTERALPMLSLGPDTAICLGKAVQYNLAFEDVSYSWNGGEGKEPSFIAEIGSLTVELTTADGCVVADTVNIFEKDDFQVDLGADTILCEASLPVSVSSEILGQANGGDFIYSWSSGERTSSIAAPQAGVYILSVEDEQGCKATDTIIINTVSVPFLELPSTIEICEGDKKEVVPSYRGDLNFLWDSGEQSPNIMMGAGDRGEKKLTVYNSHCSTSARTSVVVHPLPFVSLGEDTFICFRDTSFLTLNAQAAGDQNLHYFWNDEEVYGEQSIAVYQAGKHHVRVQDENNCEYQAEVQVDNWCAPQFYVPNAFSPNGDGINDTWEFVGEGIVDFSVTVLNRWGEEIWQGNHINDVWDGTYRRRPVAQDVYVYKIDYTYSRSPEYLGRSSRTGTISLIR